MKVNCSRWWRVFSTCQAHAVCHLPFTIWQDLSTFKWICFNWNYICSNCKIYLFRFDQFKIDSFQLNQIAKYICSHANHAFCSLLFMIQLLDAAKYILEIINHRIINLICSNFACQACLLLFKIHPWAALWTGSECFENIFAWLLFKYLDIFVQMSGRSCVIYRLQFNSMSGGSEGFSTDIDAREVCHIATGLQVPCKCNAAIQAAHNNSDSTRQWNCTWVLQDV